MHLSPAQSRRALIFASLLFLPPTLIIGIWLAQYGGFAFEPPLMHAVHAYAGTWFDPIATVLHYLGKTAIAVPLIGAVAATLYFADKKREALFCVLAALVPTLNMLIVKVWFARERPLLWPRLIEESNFSFPSGHSTFSAAIAVMLILLCRRTRYRRLDRRYFLCPADRVFTHLFGRALSHRRLGRLDKRHADCLAGVYAHLQAV